MKNKRQSPKDIAFEKERAKYRKEIRELKHDILSLNQSINQKNNELNILRNEILQKSDWIRRLLEYTELSDDDMKAIINREKSSEKVMDMLSKLSRSISRIYGT